MVYCLTKEGVNPSHCPFFGSVSASHLSCLPVRLSSNNSRLSSPFCKLKLFHINISIINSIISKLEVSPKIASHVGGGNLENMFEVEACGSGDNCVILAGLLGGMELSSSSSFSRLLFELTAVLSTSSVDPVFTSDTSPPTTGAQVPSQGGGDAPSERTGPDSTSPWAP